MVSNPSIPPFDSLPMRPTLGILEIDALLETDGILAPVAIELATVVLRGLSFRMA